MHPAYFPVRPSCGHESSRQDTSFLGSLLHGAIVIELFLQESRCFALLRPLHVQLYVLQPDLTSRFELFINGQEFCNAYVGMFVFVCLSVTALIDRITSELNDAAEQKQRMRQQALVCSIDDQLNQQN